MLPPEGFRIPIDFGMSWSPKTGVVFHGGATLEVELPINLDLSIIKIPSIFLSLGAGIKPNEPPKAALGVAATVDLEIGPVFGTVEQMGVVFNFAFPEKGGNLGPVDLSLGFKPPKGVGMSVKAGSGRGRRIPLPGLRQGRVRRHPAPGDRQEDLRHGDRAAQHQVARRVARATRSSS